MNTLQDVHQQFASLFHNQSIFPYAEALSRQMADGHVCIDLKQLEDQTQTQDHIQHLRAIPNLVSTDESTIRPFVLNGSRLYLHRYFSYESDIIQSIKRFLAIEKDLMADRRKLLNDNNALLQSLFPTQPNVTNWQYVAATAAFLHQFSIISGGPGTGKTTTVSKLLILLYQSNPQLKVALAAPTGKAAMRMADALKAAIQQVEVSATVKQLFEHLQPQTIHSLLKFVPNSTQFKHNQDNPLPFDLVIIDESSMVDVALMAKLLNAIQPTSRVLLLGDRNQLASVEAGSIFGDLCQINADAAPDSPLYQHLTELKQSHRFDDNKGIGKLSKAIITGDVTQVLNFYSNSDPAIFITDNQDDYHFKQFIEQYKAYIEEPDKLLALQKFNQIRVLCAVREGDQGVFHFNQRIENYLQQAGYLNLDNLFYTNRPLMVTQNNPSLGLFNGDIGIIRSDGDGPKVWFLDSKQALRSVLPGYITKAETVFAMTIHKSQGSEYQQVMVVLPESGRSELLTRELLYTGVTRAKEKVILRASQEVVTATVSRTVKRVSGLSERFHR